MSRKYQWFNEGMNQRTVLYDGDVPGGVELICGYCNERFIDPNVAKKEEELQNCPHCGNDIVFPRAEW